MSQLGNMYLLRSPDQDSAILVRGSGGLEALAFEWICVGANHQMLAHDVHGTKAGLKTLDYFVLFGCRAPTGVFF